MPFALREDDLVRLDLTGRVKKVERWACGGYSDIWQGHLHTETGELEVAIKELRMVQCTTSKDEVHVQDRLRKRCAREGLIWQTLEHPNIVPFLGYTLEALPALISPWYTNGNVKQYLDVCPDANRPSLVLDAAEGLQYLHSKPVVHGDIKAENLLVSSEGRAILCDFGLSKFIEDTVYPTGNSTSNANIGGTVRFMSPELFREAPKTFKSDIWAFGCLAAQIIADRTPYAKFSRREAIHVAVMRGEPPLTNDDGFIDWDTWNYLKRCWKPEPADRPSASDLASHLKTYIPPSESDMPLKIVTPSSVNRASGVSVLDEPRVKDIDLGDRIETGERLKYYPWFDLFSGTLRTDHRKEEVMVLTLRTRGLINKRNLKSSFFRELLSWRSIQHPNVAPLLGYTRRFSDAWSLVFPRKSFLSADSMISLREADRLQLALDIAKGLEYLHSLPVVHGDITLDSVVVNVDGHACLCNTGISQFIEGIASSGGLHSIVPEVEGRDRYISPELFEDKPKTVATDIWAFGCLVVQILTGRIPYEGIPYGGQMFLAIIYGDPPMSNHNGQIEEVLWNCLTQCWSTDPTQRPIASTLNSALETCFKRTLGVDTLKTLGPFRELPIPENGEVASLEYSPDGRYLAAIIFPDDDEDENNLLVLWKVLARGLKLHRAYNCSAESMTWSPSGDRMVVTCWHQVEILSSENFTVIATYQRIGSDGVLARAVWLPHGDAVGYINDKEISIQHLTNRSKSANIVAPFSVHALAFTLDSKCMILAGACSSPQTSEPPFSLVAFNMSEMVFEGKAPLYHPPSGINLVANGGYILMSYAGSPPELWKVQTSGESGTEHIEFSHLHTYGYIRESTIWTNVQFGGIDDQFVIGLSDDGNIHFWDRRTAIHLHSSRVTYFTHDPANHLLGVTWNHASSETFMFASLSSPDKITIWSTPPKTSTAAGTPESSPRRNRRGRLNQQIRNAHTEVEVGESTES